MKEQAYQKKISDKLTAKGWFVINMIKTNKNGIPDLQATKKGEPVMYIECKTPTGKLAEIQKYRLNQLTKLGFNCFVSYGMDIQKWIVSEKVDTKLF